MILKNYKVLLLIFFVVLALVLIGPNMNPQGYKVTGVKGNASDVKLGTVIYEINGEKITQDMFDRNYDGIVKLTTDKGAIFLRINGTLCIAADQVQATNLRFGLDIKGGIHALVKLNDSSLETANQVKSTLQTRINVFGLKETVFKIVNVNGQNFIDISISGGNLQELVSLLQAQGRFEGKIDFSASSLNLDNKYNITVNDTGASIGSIFLKPGETAVIDGMSFMYNGRNGNRANLTALVFTSTDKIQVFFDPQRSRIENTGSGFQWSFGIQISPESAARFAKVTRNMASAGGYLDGHISLYLDDNLIDTLSISSTLKGKAETEISISGGADSMQEAVAVRSNLQAILRSGALPTSIEVQIGR